MYKVLGWSLASLLFAAAPSSTNYTLRNYDIGSGGGASSSTNYRLNGTTGTQTSGTQSSTTYNNSSGLANTDNSSVPPAPAFTNPSNYYDRLRLVISTGGNAADTKYLIAISTDNFVTTNYVQTDNTIGSSSATTNYQTYAAWGGASGFLILGMSPSTTYQVKVKAIQGDFTNTAYGPVATAATVATSLSVSLATSASATPPFTVSFPQLVIGSALDSSSNVLFGISTNALGGGTAYVRSQYGGLYSTLANSTIPSLTLDLTGASGFGYGAQITSMTQTSGGPATASSPYNGSGTNIGQLQTSLQPLYSSPTAVTNAQASVVLKARARAIYPSAPDYTDTLTFVATALF